MSEQTTKSETPMYPIMDGPSVPWEVMAPHEAMAQKNHSQTLARLAQRGGLSPSEAWCVVKGIKLSGLEYKEQWQHWTASWAAFADETNQRYSALRQQLTTALAERDEARKALLSIVEYCNGDLMYNSIDIANVRHMCSAAIAKGNKPE